MKEINQIIPIIPMIPMADSFTKEELKEFKEKIIEYAKGYSIEFLNISNIARKINV